VTVVELGGPKSVAAQTCSALRVRRLVAGELPVDESATAEDHLASCAKCRAVRAEVEGERRALAEAVPFEAFAAGVAERLARAEAPAAAPRRLQRYQRATLWLGSLAAAAAVFAVVHTNPGRVGTTEPAGLARETRTKGGPALSVFAVRATRTFALREGEASEQGDRLLPSLEPAGHPYAIVALLEPKEISLLFNGHARPGPLPEAFEWTGGSARARIAAVYSDAPLDEAAVLAALLGGAPDGIQGAQVVFHTLERKGAPLVPR
jgi:hypothetical protein